MKKEVSPDKLIRRVSSEPHIPSVVELRVERGVQPISVTHGQHEGILAVTKGHARL
jgi:hypothetical protein